MEITPSFTSNPTFVEWAQRLYEASYTGPTTVHWLHGTPKLIEFQREHTQIAIDTGVKSTDS